jgi:hypothetical protein
MCFGFGSAGFCELSAARAGTGGKKGLFGCWDYRGGRKRRAFFCLDLDIAKHGLYFD